MKLQSKACLGLQEATFIWLTWIDGLGAQAIAFDDTAYNTFLCEPLMEPYEKESLGIIWDSFSLCG